MNEYWHWKSCLWQFWPRQLVKKWLNLRNTGNIKFDRDTDMDVEHTVEEESGKQRLSNPL